MSHDAPKANLSQVGERTRGLRVGVLHVDALFALFGQGALNLQMGAEVIEHAVGQLRQAGRLRQEQWLQDGHKMATGSGRPWVAGRPICIRRFGSGPGIRTLNLAVNRSLRPVRKWGPEFAECH